MSHSLQELFCSGCEEEHCGVRRKEAQRSAPASAKTMRRLGRRKPRIYRKQRRAGQASWPPCHAAFDPTCARCRWQRYRDKWCKTYGTFVQAEVASGSILTGWLQEKPYGGPGSAWGIGCSVCSELQGRIRAARQHMPRRAGLWSSKWARFEVNSLSAMQGCSVQQHSQTQAHKAAVMAHLMQAKPLSLFMDAQEDGRAVFAQKVPQVRHWVRLLRSLHSPVSWSTAAAFQQTEAFLAAGSPNSGAASRKSLVAMMEIMAEETRSRKRELLRQAESISIALDDRGEYRLVRFRCDCPLGYAAGKWAHFSGLSKTGEDNVSGLPLRAQARGPLGVREGVLCVLPRCDADALDLADVDKDHSDVMKESVRLAIRRFCTPLGRTVDHELDKHIVSAYIPTQLMAGPLSRNVGSR